jgi:hypothetical protein
MANIKISLIEKICFAFVIAIILIAFGLFFFNPPFLDVYLEEDGIVEWLTVVGLLCGFFVCAYRFVTLFKKKSWWFLTVVFILGLLLFVAAGEEISWGQRIFGIHSSEYFIKNNAQGETNIHNLVVNGVKINKLVFSTMLIAALGIFLLVLPLLYRYNNSIKHFIDRSGVPVPRLYQILSFIVLFAVSGLLKHDRNPELLECGAASLFFLIIYNPLNKVIYQKFSNKIYLTEISK